MSGVDIKVGLQRLIHPFRFGAQVEFSASCGEPCVPPEAKHALLCEFRGGPELVDAGICSS